MKVVQLRLELEKREQATLSAQACLSSQTKGREQPEEPCGIRTEFQRDRDRIIHCKAFRRLKHKTQVFIAPEGDHFRTRLTHTLEVAQIARTIARALSLNEDLTEAIAVGHDLGHTPFGHAGEEALQEVAPEGFKHNEQSLRVVECLENEGHGLNLTWEVRNGILHHTGAGMPVTLEGQIVRIADRIAYVNHDIDDAVRAGILDEGSLPRDLLSVLGFCHRERINTMVLDLIENSMGKEQIKMSGSVGVAMDQLRDFLFAHVYVGSAAKTEEGKAKRLVQQLYRYYADNPEELPSWLSNRYPAARAALDHIAGMTDRYATDIYVGIFVPSGFQLLE